MNANDYRFSKTVWLIGFALFLTFQSVAATFTNSARIEITDSSGLLSWKPATNALTVSCWFKLSIPTDIQLSEHMTILVDRRSGTESDRHAYLIKFNPFNGNIEFSSRGSSGIYTNTLIERPYLERWYHVAIARQGEAFSCFVDGRPTPSAGFGIAGDSGTTDGVSIGGWGNGKYLMGEVQEVAIYQSYRDQEFLVGYMFQNQPTNDPMLHLQGYYKLAFSVEPGDQYRNFAASSIGAGTKQGSGDIGFEETNQAGEQSAFDSRKNGGRDALVPLSGGFAWTQTALSRPTPGIAFDFQFGYSSANAFGTYKLNNFDPYASGPMGKGWRHTFETRVLPAQAFSPLADTDTVGLMMWDGAIETWERDQNTGEYKTRSKEYRGELVLTATNCVWTTPERIQYSFKRPDTGSPSQMRGRLLSVRDFNNNVVQLRWNETSTVITQVVDSAEGVYDFKYGAGLLTNVAFQQWQVSFAYDTTNRLISKTLTNTSGIYTNVNTRWQFAYGTNGLLEHIIDPRGSTNLFVQYDKYGRKTNQVDALNRATKTEYGAPEKRQIRHTDPASFAWIETYDRKHRLLSQRDPLGNETRYTYNERGNRISITEPLGWITFFGYDDRANVVARTNALAEVTRWKFHPFFNKPVEEVDPLGWTNFYEINNANGNLLRHFDDIGTLVAYTYGTNGLALSSTNANGYQTHFGYDTNGFLISKTDAATNTWIYTVNDVGWKLGELNPLHESTTLTLDLNGNVVRIVDPLNRTFTKTYDGNGNLLTESDGKSQLTRHFYDLADQRTETLDRAGNTNHFFYSSRGKLERVTDPLGNSTTNFFDSANRLERTSNALGFTTTNLFDANGNAIAFIDQVGQRWSKTYDRLNRVVAETDPHGDSKRTSYDSVGRIKEVITPNGYPSVHFYDGRGRLTKWIDPENFEWKYDYDGVGNITNITDALNGKYVMNYGPRNERILERNQDNKEWQYTYDELLRLKQQMDPNRVTRELEYDIASRLRSITFTTGRKNTIDYDFNDNPTVIVRRQNNVAIATIGFTYDQMDRVQTVTDPHQQNVGYGFDSIGRVTSITYPGNKILQQRFDAIGRMTNQTDWAGRQMNYVFDNASRLIRRSYPNGVVQTNTLDSSGQLTSLTYSPSTLISNSLNIALTYAYDRTGNKTNMTERGTMNWPLPSLRDDISHFTAAGRITNRVDSLSPTNNFNYQYDQNGNMTNAAGAGQSWKLTYDEDNRTTSIFWINGALNDVLITNRFDALGRRIAKTVDGITTRYVLDLAGGMERILCDMDSSGTITSYYIHGPDLAYKVDATNSVTCFHADAQANIIALSGTNGVLLSQYAYTPYGRSLGSTNLQSQISNPYLFVGSQGVMEELPGLYFMRARYYSAEAGVFLSTDPVKKIGPGWKPEAYSYAANNPFGFVDPDGNMSRETAAKIQLYQAETLYWENEAIYWNARADVFQGVHDALQTTTSLFTGDVVGVATGLSEQTAALLDGLGKKDLAQALRGGNSLVELGDAALSIGKLAKNADKLSAHYTRINGNWSKIQNYSATGPVGGQYKSLLSPIVDIGFKALGTGIGSTIEGGNSSFSSRTPSAGSHAQKLNAKQQTAPSSNSGHNGTTSSISSGGSPSGSSGKNGFTQVVNSVSKAVSKATNSITQQVKSVTATAKQAVKSVVKKISSWFR